ncbi:hypothetical protein PTH_0930 [Pelotomaculum thermopropionicum SI]|uniref:Uncharacterized protein n=1 Tax=Pelotomaculum thermopropionicum (strain DSM 13744 / JCM 10971 / SI) TaxID=370438 RepID=A5D3T8_PELTS|nr:hypothetical protein PTH_0930 [Pelotomaculum thermopropionicum SI]
MAGAGKLIFLPGGKFYRPFRRNVKINGEVKNKLIKR